MRDTLIKQRIWSNRTAYEKSRRKKYLQSKHLRIHGATVSQNYDWKLRREIVVAPEIMDFNEHREVTLEFAKICRTNSLVRRKRSLLNFAKTTKISSPAMLFLVAEIDRCRRIGGAALVNGTYPKDKNLSRQMQASGFYDALGVKSDVTEQEKSFPLEYIKVMSANQADGRLARELRQKLLGPLEANLAKDAKSSFFRGLSEAMTNVSQHAYPDDWSPDKIKPLRKTWWMLGHINKLRKELKVMIVDQGIGIPRSLPRAHTKERIKELLSLLSVIDPTDGQMIRAAMEVGRSRLDETNRGKGLNDLKQIIDVCGAGTLRILSNKGEYRYTNNKNEKMQSYNDSLNGTLIEWSIPLKAILPFIADEQI